MSVILNYSKNYYRNKVSELQAYGADLEAHLNELDDLKEEIKRHWRDEQGKMYYGLIVEKIKGVRTALARVRSMTHIYENTTAAIDRTNTAGKDLINEATGIVNSLGLTGDTSVQDE